MSSGVTEPGGSSVFDLNDHVKISYSRGGGNEKYTNW
jgi:hypothetical protein